MSEVVWEDPPPVAPRRLGQRNTKQRRTAAFVAELRAHPGKWARYPFVLKTDSSAKSTASHIRRGDWVHGEGFEAAAREVDGTPTVYARFVGES